MASAVAPGRGIPPRDVPPGPTSPRLETYDDAETYASGSSDVGYLDAVAADTSLGADMANAIALRDAKAKSKRLPVKDVSTANNALRDMYEEAFDFTDEQALARAAASYKFEREDRSDDRVSDDRADDRADAGVFTPDERRASALESLRAKQRWKQAYVANAVGGARSRSSDLGDADASEWIPHVFADGGGSVAWFKSRDAMTASERARADAVADRAEGKGVVPSARRDAGEKASPKKGERLEEAADVERVVRVTRRAETPPIGANSTDSTGNGGARDKVSEATERPRGVRAEGRRVAAARVSVVPAGRRPRGGVCLTRRRTRARVWSSASWPRTRAVTWWTPRASTRTRVAGQTRTIWSCARARLKRRRLRREPSRWTPTGTSWTSGRLLNRTWRATFRRRARRRPRRTSRGSTR